MRIVKAPVFYVDGKAINEYTVRAHQVDVAKGLVKSCNITDITGKTVTVRPDGRLTGPLKGMELATNLLMQLVDDELRDLSQEYTEG
jgi:cytoskeletal protein CcmA (bactofilin family)